MGLPGPPGEKGSTVRKIEKDRAEGLHFDKEGQFFTEDAKM